MEEASLADLYGPPDQIDHPQPEQMLLDLGYGHFINGQCSPKPSQRSRHWLRVLALPERDPQTTPPLERLPIPLSGSGIDLEILLHRSETAGLRRGSASTA